MAALAAERRPEVLTPAPHWPSYLPLAALAGAQTVVVPGPTGRIDITALRRAAGPSTGAVLVNSPRNPDGATLDDGQLADLIAWTEAAGLLLIFDQVYRGVPLPGPIAPSLANLPGGLPAGCVIVDGLSKSHALAGLRIGWTIAAPMLTAAIVGLASHIIGGTSRYAQDVAIAALSVNGTGLGAAGEVLAANRDYGAARLAAVPGVTCGVPAGGIFLFPSFADWLADQPIGPDGLVPWLLDQHGLAVVDGAAFGAPGHVRLSYAVEPELCRAGVDRLCAALMGGSP